MTAETLFQAASISKPVAAMGILRLVQDGTLSLDADINSMLKSWKFPAGEHTRDRPVTLRALLSHTSGLGDGFGFPGYHPKDTIPSVVQILNGEKPSNTGKVLMERPPFTAIKYSGGGVTIVQLAATDTTGRPFAALMRSLVLDPIGTRAHLYSRDALELSRDGQDVQATPQSRTGYACAYEDPFFVPTEDVNSASPSEVLRIRRTVLPSVASATAPPTQGIAL